jgi:hypothetical protein
MPHVKEREPAKRTGPHISEIRRAVKTLTRRWLNTILPAGFIPDAADVVLIYPPPSRHDLLNKRALKLRTRRGPHGRRLALQAIPSCVEGSRTLNAYMLIRAQRTLDAYNRIIFRKYSLKA